VDAGEFDPRHPDPAGDLDRRPGVVRTAVLRARAQHHRKRRRLERGLVGPEGGEAGPLRAEEVVLVPEEPLPEVGGPAVRPLAACRLREPAAGRGCPALLVQRGQFGEEAAPGVAVGQDVHGGRFMGDEARHHLRVQRGQREADDRAPAVAEDQRPAAGQPVDERAGVGGLHGEFHRRP
jgi:hypothetical protein